MRAGIRWSFGLFQRKSFCDSTNILLNIKTLSIKILCHTCFLTQALLRKIIVYYLFDILLFCSFFFPPIPKDLFSFLFSPEYCSVCVCVWFHSRGYQLILNSLDYTFKSSFPGQVLLPGNKGHESVNTALLIGLKSL